MAIPSVICVIVVAAIVVDEPRHIRSRLPAIIVICGIISPICFHQYRHAAAKRAYEAGYRRGRAEATKHYVDGSYQYFAYRKLYVAGARGGGDPLAPWRHDTYGYRAGIADALPEGAGYFDEARQRLQSVGAACRPDFAKSRDIMDCSGIILSGPKVNDSHVEWLLMIKQLESVTLQDAPVTDRALKVLRHHPALRHVRICRTKITPEAISEFKALPREHRLRVQVTDRTWEGKVWYE